LLHLLPMLATSHHKDKKDQRLLFSPISPVFRRTVAASISTTTTILSRSIGVVAILLLLLASTVMTTGDALGADAAASSSVAGPQKIGKYVYISTIDKRFAALLNAGGGAEEKCAVLPW
jgi:hypothetical protein